MLSKVDELLQKPVVVINLGLKSLLKVWMNKTG